MRLIGWIRREIGILLQEKYPEVEPYSVRFTDLHKYVIGLPGFVGDPAKSNGGRDLWRQFKRHGMRSGRMLSRSLVLPGRLPARRAATSWRVYRSG